MKFRKFLTIILAALLIISLSACGAATNAPMSNGGSNDYYNRYEKDTALEAPELSDSTSASTSSTQLPQSQKLVQKVWLKAETEDMNALLADVNQRIAALNGYVEAQNIYNGSNYSGRTTRTASLTIRIPAENLEQFTQQVSAASNIVSSNKTTDNVTLNYVATESRITALQVEQTRLLELLEKAETMKDLLTIEERLTQVRTELEKVTSQLRLYDNLVDYATVYLEITEVKEYTEPVVEPETMGERIAAGFAESMEDIGQGLEDFIVWLAASSPYLVILAVIVVIVILLIKLRKGKKNKKQPPETPVSK